jgi:hypothetical protein
MVKSKNTTANPTQTETITTSRRDKRKARREEERRIKRGEAKADSSSKRQFVILSSAVALIISIFIYLLRLDGVVGQFLDDAWYALLAKSLATGSGYMLINSPTPGIMPLYPPGFPLLLSLAYRISPQFPQNLWLLKSVSIAAMMGAGVVTYFYFRQIRALSHTPALGIAAATALCPVLVFLATSTLMSECVFTLAQMLAIFIIERCVQAERKGDWRYALLGAAFTAFAYLTRSIALGLIVAAIIYLVKERLMRAAIIFVAGVALLAGPWAIYSRLHAPTAEQKAEQSNSYIVRGYGEQFWDRVAGHKSKGSVSVSDLPARFGDNIATITTQDIGGMTVSSMFRSLNQGMGERQNTGRALISILLSALALAGFILTFREKITLAEIAIPLSLAIIITWPFPTFRYVVPFVPFVIFYIGMGGVAIYRLSQRGVRTTDPQPRLAIIGIVAWCVVAFALHANFDYIGRKYADSPMERPRWIQIFEENEAMLQWASQNLPSDGAIAAQNPALVHLYTGRKTTTFDDPAGNWELWNRLGIRYVMHTSPIRVAEPDASESQYRVIYRSRGALNLRITDLGPPSSRVPWKK